MIRFITLTLLFGSMLMGQTIQDFTRIYDAYLAGVKSGEFRKVSTLFSQELRNEIKTKEDQQEFMRMANYMVAESYEPLFFTMIEGGRKAELQVVITIKVPEDVQKERKLPPTQRMELILCFVKEDDQWKWGWPTILGDPDNRSRPKDLKMGSRNDYKPGSNTQMGGQVLHMDKQADGTVYTIRVLNEEIATFVPSAKVSSEFVPGCILILRGAEHQSDKLKFWADEASLHQR